MQDIILVLNSSNGLKILGSIDTCTHIFDPKTDRDSVPYRTVFLFSIVNLGSHTGKLLQKRPCINWGAIAIFAFTSKDSKISLMYSQCIIFLKKFIKARRFVLINYSQTSSMSSVYYRQFYYGTSKTMGSSWFAS